MAVRQSTHRFFCRVFTEGLRRDNGGPSLLCTLTLRSSFGLPSEFLRSGIGVVTGKTVWESSTK